jgi:hypothetical protein
MQNLYTATKSWVVADWQEHPTRCVLEILAWMMSIACAVILAVTVPDAPWFVLYPLFITQCTIFAWAAWTRRSTGMLANYSVLVVIDTFALVKLIVI